MVQSVNHKGFSQVVLESRVPVLVSFWTPWCGLCKLIEPHLSQLEESAHAALHICKINADENFSLANRYRLTNVPTLLLFEGGEVIERIDTFSGREDLKTQLGQMLSRVTTLPNSA